MKLLCIFFLPQNPVLDYSGMKSRLIYSQYTLAVLTKAMTEAQPAVLLPMWPRTRSCVTLPKDGRFKNIGKLVGTHNKPTQPD